MRRSVTLTLDQLAAAGLKIEQHHYDPRPDEWFNNGEGPSESPEAAVLAGIKRIIDAHLVLEQILNDDAAAFRKAQAEHEA
jgi:hypothetical protein